MSQCYIYLNRIADKIETTGGTAGISDLLVLPLLLG